MGTVSTVPSITVAGRVFTDLDNLLILYGRATSQAGTGFSLTTLTDGTKYQATGGVLEVLALRLWRPSGGGLTGISIGHDSVEVDFNDATLTAPEYYKNDLSNYLFQTTVDQQWVEFLVDMEVPDGRWPLATGLPANQTYFVEIYCYQR